MGGRDAKIRFLLHQGHDDVIKWKRFPRYWPLVWAIYRSPVNYWHKGQWRGASVFSLICVRMNGWVNNREAGDLRRHRVHYNVTVMQGNCLDPFDSNSRPCDSAQSYICVFVCVRTYVRMYVLVFTDWCKMSWYQVVKDRHVTKAMFYPCLLISAILTCRKHNGILRR